MHSRSSWNCRWWWAPVAKWWDHNVHEFESPDSTLLDGGAACEWAILRRRGQPAEFVAERRQLRAFHVQISRPASRSAYLPALVATVPGFGGTGNDTPNGQFRQRPVHRRFSLSPKITTIIGGSGQYTIINNGNYAIYNPTQSSTALILSAAAHVVRATGAADGVDGVDHGNQRRRADRVGNLLRQDDANPSRARSSFPWLAGSTKRTAGHAFAWRIAHDYVDLFERRCVRI